MHNLYHLDLLEYTTGLRHSFYFIVLGIDFFEAEYTERTFKTREHLNFGIADARFDLRVRETRHADICAE